MHAAAHSALTPSTALRCIPAVFLEHIMLPTPDTSQVPFERVYEPAEDSFLVLDTLSSPSEVLFLQSRFSQAQSLDRLAPLILEVGSGSGVIVAFLTAHAQSLFGRADIVTAATDLNFHACRATSATVAKALSDKRQNKDTNSESLASSGFFLDPLQADLSGALRANLVDVLVCNPPYVPTRELPSSQCTQLAARSASASEDYERDSYLLSLSYAGGADGMEMTWRLIERLPQILSAKGCAYILLCAQNKPDRVKREAIRLLGAGWLAETVGSSGKTAGWERLVVVRIWRSWLT
jgi:release factor glutamine methyltransferase